MNKLVDQYNNTYHCSIGKIPMDADCSALNEDIESSCKAPKFKDIQSGLLSTRIFLAKVTLKD